MKHSRQSSKYEVSKMLNVGNYEMWGFYIYIAEHFRWRLVVTVDVLFSLFGCYKSQQCWNYSQWASMTIQFYAKDDCSRFYSENRRRKSWCPLEGKLFELFRSGCRVHLHSHSPLLLPRKVLSLWLCPCICRWSERNHREKIGVHVLFDQVLNMEPYCCRDSLSSLDKETFVYDLSAVVMHHGKGFGSGHYTAYCYNTEGGACALFREKQIQESWFLFHRHSA